MPSSDCQIFRIDGKTLQSNFGDEVGFTKDRQQMSARSSRSSSPISAKVKKDTETSVEQSPTKKIRLDNKTLSPEKENEKETTKDTEKETTMDTEKETTKDTEKETTKDTEKETKQDTEKETKKNTKKETKKETTKDKCKKNKNMRKDKTEKEL